ncbi:trans-resveratrol di-O-methyltransferase-like [Gossypium australe]|uniref:Trans-resveratrol di-O-methyltransferase-like n=1 Tax=Gossypium australe TaxID=47621 RepID=A0A5B6WIH3_9ROSI|nr:trans-resveratrol di-O-methyltransferase-like [Gossypium australe]
MLGNLNINTVSEEGAGEENSSGICPYILGSVLNNRTVEGSPVFFRAKFGVMSKTQQNEKRIPPYKE